MWWPVNAKEEVAFHVSLNFNSLYFYLLLNIVQLYFFWLCFYRNFIILLQEWWNSALASNAPVVSVAH